jgi:hypothetical protein
VSTGDALGLGQVIHRFFVRCSVTEDRGSVPQAALAYLFSVGSVSLLTGDLILCRKAMSNVCGAMWCSVARQG